VLDRAGLQAEFLSDVLGQRHFAHELIAPGYGFAPRPTRRVATLPGFPRRHEAFSVWIAVRHSVFLSVLAPIAQTLYFLPEINLPMQPEMLGWPVCILSSTFH